jgi:hypothetical protein
MMTHVRCHTVEAHVSTRSITWATVVLTARAVCTRGIEVTATSRAQGCVVVQSTRSLEHKTKKIK